MAPAKMLEEKHGTKSRRAWCKLLLAVDADSSEIIGHSLTDQETRDTSQMKPLLDRIDNKIGRFTADGAYDGYPIYDADLQQSNTPQTDKGRHSTALERS